jgi:predicted MFS family arabinose efflux permease
MKDSSAGDLAALIGVVFVAMTGFGVFLPVFPFLALHVGASPTQATLAMGAYSFGQLIAAPIWGRISDRIGRKPILIAGLIASMVSYLLLAHADTILGIGGARLFAGLMAGNMGAAFAAAADLARPATRARNMGLLGAAAGTAFIAGPGIGALIVSGASGAEGFTRVCYASAVLALLAALAAVFLFRETLPKEKRRDPAMPRVRSRMLLRTRPVLTRLAAIMLLVVTGQAMLESVFGLWADVEFHWGAKEVGWTLAGLGFGAALMQGGASGAAARRIGEDAALRIGLVFSAAGFVLATQASHHLVAIAALAALVIGFGLITPALQSLFAAQGGEDERGAVMGLAQSSSALGRVLGPATSGAIFDAFGHDAPFYVGAILLSGAFIAGLGVARPQIAPSS